jgi:hypothetical protein
VIFPASPRSPLQHLQAAFPLLIAMLAFSHGIALCDEVSFRQGQHGYKHVTDTEIWRVAPTQPLYKQGTMTSDANNGGGESQVLIRFDNIIGDEQGLLPPKSHILRAKLTVVAFDPGTTVYMHRMLVPWKRSATWKGMAAGVATDNVEASELRDGFTFGQIQMDKQSVEFDVTRTVQDWVNGDDNFGWVFVNTGSNGWDFYSSDWHEEELRPMLTIEFASSASVVAIRP